ncbi:MAG TPA: hypothetical protein VH206_14895 [Xanthobacteraceae bacterium]|jgi:hypothetical protein|nr:hypothetical protein [Xanthobacteraceae bacterium]
MLSDWHEFYALLGTAAAALVALLFVAASIATGYISVDRSSPTHTFTSPVVFHYTFVLFVSLIALMPIDTDTLVAFAVGSPAALAFAYSVSIFVRVIRSKNRELDDLVSYGASPPVAYAATLAAAIFIYAHSPVGPPLLAGALMLLLLINIRNAWDLTVFFAQRRNDATPPDNS